ncbi:hypothetical protein PHLCEN_2v4999 [Hermanssonia centrifuga]|uniref:Uncharacterized protein n=1 Tax=Hermanssonia centrifuga TaxID=98765 RepID=A0A2R6PC29_9APHY|nr:hypothetical protein PHLCEN_2v4999 [Hermanssonia centrifuga]
MEQVAPIAPARGPQKATTTGAPAEAAGSVTKRINEPNNASPLNPDAANIWDKPEGPFTALSLVRIIMIYVENAEFKIQMMKHYRPIPDEECA